MKTCSTCKHWVTGMCKRAEAGELNEYGPAIGSEICIVPYGFMEDDCGLSTGPDFGCVHHEEKP